MQKLDKLKNNGIQFIGDQSALLNQKKTIIVVGVARGGTSLISGCLHHLGVFTGDRSGVPVYEDNKLSQAIEKNNVNEINSIVESYNSRFDIWSFKRPSLINNLEMAIRTFRNPVFLIVFKDIFSISNRNKISMDSNLIQQLNNTLESYKRIVDFISEFNPNAYLYSFEKVIKNKEQFVDSLRNIIGNEVVNKKNIQDALDFINPNSSDYLDLTRNSKSIGRIGEVNQTRVVGWGKYLYSDKAAIAELYINQKLVESKAATDFRQHTLDSKAHSTGMCGFVFDLSNSPLKDGDIVSVKLSKDIRYLKNSNQVFCLTEN